MNGRCSNPNCYVHDGESCAMGERGFAECSSWLSGVHEGAPSDLPYSPSAARVPWSGSALGLSDIANLVPRGRSIVIGVLGAHDAGKTTLLTANYLQLLQGKALAGARFAGSHSLGAWESLAAWTRFEDAARLPSFPPHTPRGTGRVPGLLHLALRGVHEELRDVLLADAPGEWFTRWSMQEAAPDAEGARWVSQHADAFLVVADCQRLGGPGRGAARNDLRALIERIGNHVAQRPTALIWAKDEFDVNEPIRAAIRSALKDRIPHAVEVSTSTTRPESMVAALESVLIPSWLPRTAAAVSEPVVQYQPFAAFRGSYANA